MKNRVFIVASGPSLQGFDFASLANEDTIVVNKSIFSVPKPNYFITSDFTLLRKIDLKAFRSITTSKVFVVNLSHKYMKELNGKITDTRYNLVYKLQDFNTLIRSSTRSGIGLTLEDFRNGECSGYCAFQLAVILGYKEIYLLGLDLVCTPTSTHYHDGYKQKRKSFDKKLAIYYNEFEIGLAELKIKLPDTKIYSCSQLSRLNSLIPYTSTRKLL